MSGGWCAPSETMSWCGHSLRAECGCEMTGTVEPPLMLGELVAARVGIVTSNDKNMRLLPENLLPGTRVRAFGLLDGEVREPISGFGEPPWGVTVRLDGSSYLNIIHCGHLEKFDTCAWCRRSHVLVDRRPLPRIMRRAYANFTVTHGYLCASCSEDARMMIEVETRERSEPWPAS